MKMVQILCFMIEIFGWLGNVYTLESTSRARSPVVITCMS